jgi:hypothetical protein
MSPSVQWPIDLTEAQRVATSKYNRRAFGVRPFDFRDGFLAPKKSRRFPDVHHAVAMPSIRDFLANHGPPEQSSGFRPRGNDGKLRQI